jgi:hypothetical protein
MVVNHLERLGVEELTGPAARMLQAREMSATVMKSQAR